MYWWWCINLCRVHTIPYHTIVYTHTNTNTNTNTNDTNHAINHNADIDKHPTYYSLLLIIVW